MKWPLNFKPMETWCPPNKKSQGKALEIGKVTDNIYVAIVYLVYNDVDIITLLNSVKDLIVKSVFAK